MSNAPVRRPYLLLVPLLAASGAFVAWLALAPGDGAAQSPPQGDGSAPGGGRELVRVDEAERLEGLDEVEAGRAAERVASPDQRHPGPLGPGSDAVEFLSGEVVLVDSDGVIARHGEVGLRLSLFVDGGRRGQLIETETEGGQFDVTYVKGEDGSFALETGSRAIGEGPFEGRIAIYGATLSPGLVRLALLREVQGGGFATADRLSFELGSGPVQVFVRAPRSVTLDVFDAETGGSVGPVRILPTYREGAASGGRPVQPPVEVELSSAIGSGLVVTAEGYAPAEIAIDGDLGGVVRVPMHRAASIHARFLLDRPAEGSGSGRPVHVTLRRAGEEPSGRTSMVGGQDSSTWRRDGLAPGTYFVTASAGSGNGFRVGAGGEMRLNGRITEVTRSVELTAGEDVSLVIDLTEAAVEPRSPIVLEVLAADGEELPSGCEVELERTQPEGDSRTISASFAPGTRRGEARLGEWPAGRYRAVVMGGHATVDIEHAGGPSPTRVVVDLGEWVPWQVRLVEEDTGRPARNGSMKVLLPGSSTPLLVRPDEDRVFRFRAPIGTRACSVLMHVDPRFVRCPLPRYDAGVLDVPVPVLGRAGPAGLRDVLGR